MALYLGPPVRLPPAGGGPRDTRSNARLLTPPLVMSLAASEDGGPRGVVEFVGVFLPQPDYRTGMPDAGQLIADESGETFRSRLLR